MARKLKKGFDIQENLTETIITFNNEREPSLIKIYNQLQKCQMEDSSFSFRLKGNFVKIQTIKKNHINMVIDLLCENGFTPQNSCIFCEENTYEEICVNGKYFRAHKSCFNK